jgi:muramoyltetrapeptide carboxypeptidase
MTLARQRPPALWVGDAVGVAAPSGAVDPAALSRGVTALRGLGFEVVVPEGILERRYFAAGEARRRAAELHALFVDERVGAIFCARGGAGCSDLLGRLDPEVIRANPKLFIGYSDVTFLHLAFGALGLVTVHGPMVARDFAENRVEERSLLHAILGEGDCYRTDELRVLRQGSAEGVVRGGCLSILAAAAGTPYALRPEGVGTILFVEDVDEAPYRIARMLFQLRSAGTLKGVRGIVFGEMKGCGVGADSEYGLDDVIGDALQGLEIPVALGLPSGHTTGPGVSLPFGVRARLVCAGQAGVFEVLETAVE